MRSVLPPRWRAPAVFVMVALIPLLIGGAESGWASALLVAPILIAVAVGLYVFGGHDSDVGAVVRRQLDERQADLRLKVQALVGRVMAVAVAIAYAVAVGTRIMLWPFGALLAVMAASFATGWFWYSDHSPARRHE